MAGPLLRVVLACATLFLLMGSGCSKGAPVRGVMIVTFDTTRRDRFGCYGDDKIETPHADRLARRGARFDRAVTPVPLTLPAHTSIMSGVLPPGHQVYENGLYRVGERLPLLAPAFKENGFATGAFVGSVVLSKGCGLERGFDLYDDEIQATREQLISERRASVVTDHALAWLAERLKHDDEFFLWVHFFDPHLPRDPVEPHRTRYAFDGYRGEIAECDAQFGRLVASIDAAGRLDSTLVVLTADHGESLGEHDEDTHGYFIYDSTQLVPLIVAGPGVNAGLVAPSVVSLVDIAPTLLEICRLPLPAGIAGRSLAPYLSSGQVALLAPEPAYCETRYSALHFGWSNLFGIRTDAYKLIDAPRPELYDLQSDPQESVNLFDRQPEVAQALMRALIAKQEQARFDDAGTEQLLVTDEMRARLQNLGYLSRAAAAAAVPGREARDPKDMLRTYHRIIRLPAYDKTSRQAECIAEARLALREDPDNPSALSSLGVALAVCSRFDEAVTPLKRAVEVGEESMELRYRLGVSYFQLGQDGLALPELSRCIELNPNEPIPYRYLGLIADRAGESGQAIAQYRKFLELYRGDPAWSDNIKARLQELEHGAGQ